VTRRDTLSAMRTLTALAAAAVLLAAGYWTTTRIHYVAHDDR